MLQLSNIILDRLESEGYPFLVTGPSRIGKTCFCLALAYMTFEPEEISYGWDYDILLSILDPSKKCVIFDDSGKMFDKDLWSKMKGGRSLWQWICIFPKLYLFNTTSKSNLEISLRDFENIEEIRMMRVRDDELAFGIHKKYGLIYSEHVESKILADFKIKEYQSKTQMTLDSILVVMRGSKQYDEDYLREVELKYTPKI